MKDNLGPLCTFPALALISHFSSLGSFNEQWYLEAKIQVLDVLVAIRVMPNPVSLSGKKLRNIWVYLRTYTYMHLHLYLYLVLCKYV